ncbi:MAG TPA: exonuclease domain-containing protein [Blastocatellia bacterium]|nr:exonuclease domain-containing protein [Blastocatellia bacterium]
MLVNQCSLVDNLIILLGRSRAASYEQIGRDLFYLPRTESGIVRQLLVGLLDKDKRFLFHDDSLELLPDPNETRSVKDATYVVVDVETTGARPNSDRITEIAAYKISGGQIVGEINTLINPQRPISRYVVQLTGITDEMVRTAPLFSDVYEQVVDFFSDAVFVAHNAPFDWRFVNREIERVTGRGLANMRLCTVQMTRRIVPDLPNYKLHTVAEHFKIEIENRHRAGGDAFATAKIFMKLLDVMAEFGVPNVAGARKFKIAGNYSRC